MFRDGWQLCIIDHKRTVRMRTRGNYSTLFVGLSICLSVTSLLVSFHVYVTNYTTCPFFASYSRILLDNVRLLDCSI